MNRNFNILSLKFKTSSGNFLVRSFKCYGAFDLLFFDLSQHPQNICANFASSVSLLSSVSRYLFPVPSVSVLVVRLVSKSQAFNDSKAVSAFRSFLVCRQSATFGTTWC